jgi:CheY-like chemotaxis protein
MRVTVLVVDDDEVLGCVLGRVLAKEGYDVVRASSAGQACELAQRHRPQLALLDLCLPDGDGIELARQLRQELPDLTTVLATAYPLRLHRHPELAGDFAGVLTKPLDLHELRRTVARSLDRGRRMEEAGGGRLC